MERECGQASILMAGPQPSTGHLSHQHALSLLLQLLQITAGHPGPGHQSWTSCGEGKGSSLDLNSNAGSSTVLFLFPGLEWGVQHRCVGGKPPVNAVPMNIQYFERCCRPVMQHISGVHFRCEKVCETESQSPRWVQSTGVWKGNLRCFYVPRVTIFSILFYSTRYLTGVCV